MKAIDILIVRLLPFILFIIFGINLLCCWCQIDIFDFYEIHSNSAIYASSLFLISLANKRYHCIWNRAMYVFLIAVPIFNYIDAKFWLFPSEMFYLISVSTLFGVTAIITAFLAIRHFVLMSKRRLENGRS